MKQKTKLLLKFLFSVVLFILIFQIVGIEKILGILLTTDPWLFALAVFLYILVNLAMSLRISVVLKSIGEKPGLLDVFPSNLAGMLASDFSPARVGYFFTAFSLTSKFGIEIEKTILSIFGPQLLDFTIKLFSAAVIVMAVMGQLGAEGLLFNILFFIVILTTIAFAGLLVFYPPFLDRISFLEKLPLASKAFSFLSRMHDHSDKLLSIKWKIVGVTLISWLLKGAQWLILARAISIRITDDILLDFAFMMVFQAAITIIQFIPLPTLAGAGASEAGFAAILYFFGIPLEVGVSFGFLTRIIMILVDVFSLPILYDFAHKHGIDNLLKRLNNKGL